jgi:acetyl esterase/lipase
MRRWIGSLALALTLAVPAGAESFPDLEYARPDGVPLQLDLEVPEGPGPFPLVAFVHGGDFIAGSRKGVSKRLVADLRAAGIAWTSLDYRLAPKYNSRPRRTTSRRLFASWEITPVSIAWTPRGWR